jgi:ankyrin repeat protein
MLKVKEQPTVVSANDFVKSVLTNDYRWKYGAEARPLIKILLANKRLLESVKQELKLDWNFVRENINNLNSACKDPDIERLAAILISSGAGVNAKNKDGWTLLHEAAKNGCLKVAEILISSGADVNAKDTYGRTPLHRTVYWRHLEIIKILLAHGADVNAKDNEGLTPLHLAALWGHLEVAEVFLAHGADVNAKTKDGKTPLDLANDDNTRNAIKQYLKNQQKNDRYAPIESLIVNLPEN